MAAGDLTITDGFPKAAANMWMLVGTVEVDDTKRTFNIVGSPHRLLSMQLLNIDGSGTVQCELNKNAAGADVDGSVALVRNATDVVMGDTPASETYRYTAYYI